MKLKLKRLNFDAGRPVAFIHYNTAKILDAHVGDRIEASHKGKKSISIVDIAKGLVKENEISLSREAISYLKVKLGSMIDINQTPEPQSTELISKKMNGERLSKEEIYTIIKDISNNALTEAEISYFVLGVHEQGMNLQETIYLTEGMYKTGVIIKWPSHYKIVDKHSIGGIPGNRTTPIVVSICASAGLIMPKTSSRAITSAAGTADTIESITKVDFQVSELKKIVKKTGGCLAWGGSLGLAPADDKLIRVEKLLNLDPESQLIASIMSKKLAAGSKYILIDIPYGPGAKVNKSRAKKLKDKFLKIAKHFRLHVKVILTDGSQPIGNGIGPVLEMLDILKVLKRKDSPLDLERKSVMMAGEILELAGKSRKGDGNSAAQKILDSKDALKKFEEIIKAQGKKFDSLKLSKYSYSIKTNKNGKIMRIDNRAVNHMGRLLGCPIDKGSGIYLHKHVGNFVKKNDILLTFYSESDKKLDEAKKYFYLQGPIVIK